MGEHAWVMMHLDVATCTQHPIWQRKRGAGDPIQKEGGILAVAVQLEKGAAVWSSTDRLLHKGWKKVVLPTFGSVPNAGIKAADDTSALMCAHAASWL